jgi:HAD superfamily hydrolase (TIGR01549 family)
LEEFLLSPNGIRAILFDLDGTLRYNCPPSIETFLDHAVRLGVEDDPERRQQAARWVHRYWSQSEAMLTDVETYRGQEEAFWINYARLHLIAFGCPDEQAAELAPQLHHYMRDEYQPEDRVPPDVPETLRALREAGFTLGVLSNREKPCTDYLCTLGLDGYFDLAVVAGELACWKPDPLVFRLALERLDLLPEQAVYVGDNYFADIVGARNAGLRPVLIDPEGLFPEPGCPVIHKIGDLPKALA